MDLNRVTFKTNTNSVDGIANDKYFVPIVKGGNIKYFKPDGWFMEWSTQRVDFFKKDKKARYQNPSYYFKKGIAVPMVSASSITGAIIENRLFDQSIVGVFPKDENKLYYLLAFFNSPTYNKLIRTINPSTNNSSNYIKKIPFLMPEEQILKNITQNTKTIVEQLKLNSKFNKNLEITNNTLIEGLYGF